MVTSECVIEPSEKGTQRSAIKAQKKVKRLGRVGAREKHENAILSTELETILYQRKKIEDNWHFVRSKLPPDKFRSTVLKQSQVNDWQVTSKIFLMNFNAESTEKPFQRPSQANSRNLENNSDLL